MLKGANKSTKFLISYVTKGRPIFQVGTTCKIMQGKNLLCKPIIIITPITRISTNQSVLKPSLEQFFSPNTHIDVM
jgi:hypothetical protein